MRASRKVFGVFLALVVTVFGFRNTAESQTFQHPGVLVSRAQLDYVKIMVAAHTEPFYSAFLKAQNSNIGSLTYQPFSPPSDGFIKCGLPRIPTSAAPTRITTPARPIFSRCFGTSPATSSTRITRLRCSIFMGTT